jgi:hypothetical protein
METCVDTAASQRGPHTGVGDPGSEISRGWDSYG